MSISIQKYRDARMDINPNRVYSVPICSQKFTVKIENAASVSPNLITFNITTPSTRIGVQRKIELYNEFTITCSPNAANPTVPVNMLQIID